MPTILIVGAGVSGLSIAYRLQQRLPAATITVLEHERRPGGTAWTLREDGFQLEIGPNGFLDTKPATVNLASDVGLGARLIAATEAAARNRYLFLHGRLNLLPGSLGGLLRTNLLSWRGMLRFFTEPWRRPLRGTQDESIDAFARRRAGDEVANVFADALVTGIFAGDPKLLSVRACFPRVVALEQEFGSVFKGFARTAKQRRRETELRGETYRRPGAMWSFREGMRLLPETLAAHLERPLVYGVHVRRLEKTVAGWTVHAEGHDRWDADAVVLACPAHQQAAQVAELDVGLAEAIAAIPYNRVAVIGLGFRRADVPGSLDGFGYIAPQNTRRDLLGVQWCSSIFPGRAPDGAVLLRAMCGGWRRADIVGWDDERLTEAVCAELRLALGISATPIFRRIIRWDRAIPQYHVGHLERVARVEHMAANHAGLFLGGNAYRGVALNDCTEQGEVMAERVTQFIKNRGEPGA